MNVSPKPMPNDEWSKLYTKIMTMSDENLEIIWHNLEKESWGVDDLYNHNDDVPITMDEWATAVKSELDSRRKDESLINEWTGR